MKAAASLLLCQLRNMNEHGETEPVSAMTFINEEVLNENPHFAAKGRKVMEIHGEPYNPILILSQDGLGHSSLSKQVFPKGLLSRSHLMRESFVLGKLLDEPKEDRNILFHGHSDFGAEKIYQPIRC